MTTNAKFSVGEQVEVQDIDGRWYLASIAVVNPSKTYNVTWSETTKKSNAENIQEFNIRTKSGGSEGSKKSTTSSSLQIATTSESVRTTTSAVSSGQPAYIVGERVEAQGIDGRWYLATIATAGADGQ